MLKYKFCQITYANSENLSDEVVVRYRLLDNPVVHKWIRKVQLAKMTYCIDDPARFYGFGSQHDQEQQARDSINRCINVINQHEKIISRTVIDLGDQDTLNYLHHVFEVYHGLLDQQTHNFYTSAPQQVQQALANLNVLVHQCESVARGARPRHVVTWYGLPKTDVLAPEDYAYINEQIQFGTIYLNYVEIGKTVEDLAYDNDRYISQEAFRPFCHYSADFCVRFWQESLFDLDHKRRVMSNYYDQHREFFAQQGIDQNHRYYRPATWPLAQLVNADDFENIKTRRFVKDVDFV